MWGREKGIEMISDRRIAAVYFGLMQSGYEYHAAQKNPADIKLWESWRDMPFSYDASFFRGAKQTTTGIYPYASRAAALETASFYVDEADAVFMNEDALRVKLAGSGPAKGRDQDILTWINGMPRALSDVLHCEGFARYILWEENWVKHQAHVQRHEIQKHNDVISYYIKKYDIAVKKVSLILCPLKCAFSADYLVENGTLYAISSILRLEEAMHKFLEILLQPFVFKYGDEIAALRNLHRLKVEDSFFGDKKELGRLNGFLEYAVRDLADWIVIGRHKLDLDQHILSLIKPLAETSGPID